MVLAVGSGVSPLDFIKISQLVLIFLASRQTQNLELLTALLCDAVRVLFNVFLTISERLVCNYLELRTIRKMVKLDKFVGQQKHLLFYLGSMFWLTIADDLLRQ